MAEIIKMPKLGFDMAEGVLVRWVRQVGEPIQKGEILAEIETDKATVEVESHFSGVVLQHLVDPSTSVPVNEPIAIVGAAGEKIESSVTGEQTPATTGQPDNRTTEQPANQTTGQLDNRTTGESVYQSLPIKASPRARKNRP